MKRGQPTHGKAHFGEERVTSCTHLLRSPKAALNQSPEIEVWWAGMGARFYKRAEMAAAIESRGASAAESPASFTTRGMP